MRKASGWRLSRWICVSTAVSSFSNRLFTGSRGVAAMCLAQRKPKTCPALSAAPPGRVTPWVPAASPTA